MRALDRKAVDLKFSKFSDLLCFDFELVFDSPLNDIIKNKENIICRIFVEF